MKRSLRNFQVLGVGVLTPALVTHPQTAVARSIDPVQAVQAERACPGDQSQFDVAKALLAGSIFGLTSVEKFKLAGDRIPLLSRTDWRMTQGEGNSSACSTGGTCGCPNAKPGQVGPGKTAVNPALTGGTNIQKIESTAPQVTEPKVTEPKVTAPAVAAPKVTIQK